MGRMNPLDEHERKIIIEFCHLLEKSKQLFNGLRELPQYGHKQWHSYFGKTFDVYTKLWKFQQQHRAILDSKYGLKRWQIGEIASKIGQLYYHFYLRTSDTVYLSEAFSFYYAIRGRSYYTQACKEDKCELMVKKLRYYARFIVAGLLLKKVKLVKDLLKELDKQITEYGNAYQPDDQNEWRIVADEVRSFIKVEPVVSVHHPDEYVVILSHRLSPQVTPPVERTPSMILSLQEVLIIGSNSTQVKFSELTMDMFRMMQTLEREPSGDIQHIYDESPRQRYPSTPSAVHNKGYNLECGSSKIESPHKYLLFKPSPNQIFVYLASACDDLPPNGVVLLYISAEGLIVPPVKHPEDAGGYDVGGLITTSKMDVLHRESKDGKPLPSKHRELQVLHPGDLFPFTRRPMCIIVDSDNSFIFNDMPRYFGQPLIILMSPIELPTTLYPSLEDQRVEGSLFSLFLHCPLSAVCFCCDIRKMSLMSWERAQAYIDSYLAEAAMLLIRSRPESMYVAYLGDDFLRLLILRFIFCETILRMHRLFRGRSQRTRASPPLPEDIYEHPALTHIVIDLVSHLQVRGHFHDPAAGPPSTRE
ncbi:protein SCAI isoform X1 [Helicoverpa armigera]|uniref:protein SCAI isoform X1 n=1 Tax=Helicoverpa armigera TaxID=29058 RepID=UPI00211331FF|nr:protein SCAI isoform X1 [Helicoverpa armigera]XP_021190860.2 protein SCAI isoform X1 [Helicoverpa armigera]